MDPNIIMAFERSYGFRATNNEKFSVYNNYLKFKDQIHYVMSNTEDGPWKNEPNYAEWKDNETGFSCYAIRNRSEGYWMGYVAVPKSNRFYGLNYETDPEVKNLENHGGISWNSETLNDEWIFGFDCGHGYDSFPVRNTCFGPYRTLDYVMKICAELALQLAN